MNRKQWYVLAIATLLLGAYFIYLDKELYTCNHLKKLAMDKLTKEEITLEEYQKMMKGPTMNAPLDEYDIACVLQGEHFEPFIYLFNVLWIVFLVLAWLEPKK